MGEEFIVMEGESPVVTWFRKLESEYNRFLYPRTLLLQGPYCGHVHGGVLGEEHKIEISPDLYVHSSPFHSKDNFMKLMFLGGGEKPF